jgi:CBS domain containing-hemolysin-like protein
MDISYDGKKHLYRNVLMKPGESPVLSFYFRKVPLKMPSLISFIVFVLTLTAGIFLTRCVWLKLNWKTILFGIIFPGAIALIICRWYGKPLILDWILLTPLVFFTWRSGIFIGQKIKRAKEKEAALIKEIEEHNVSGENN